MWKAISMSNISYLIRNLCYKNSIAAIVIIAKAVYGSFLWPLHSYTLDSLVRLITSKRICLLLHITKYCNINKCYKSIFCPPLLPNSLFKPNLPFLYSWHLCLFTGLWIYLKSVPKLMVFHFALVTLISSVFNFYIHSVSPSLLKFPKY